MLGGEKQISALDEVQRFLSSSSSSSSLSSNDKDEKEEKEKEFVVDCIVLLVLVLFVPFSILESRRFLLGNLEKYLQSCLLARLKAHFQLESIIESEAESSFDFGNKKEWNFFEVLDTDGGSVSPLPYVMTPFYLVSQAIKAGHRGLGAELYWKTLLLPENMFSTSLALKKMNYDFDEEGKKNKKLHGPFYARKFVEVKNQDWGWGGGE